MSITGAEMTGHKEEIGSTLRAARQAAGLSLQQIAGEIRIRPIYLQAIEAGQFELLPALPQTVGFTRAYAKHLHVDVEAPLSRLGEEVHRDIESRVYSEPEPLWTVSPRRVGYVGIGAVVGALLLGLAVFDFGSPPEQIASVSAPQFAPVQAPVSSSPVASALAGNTLLLPREQVQSPVAPVTAALASRPAVPETAVSSEAPASGNAISSVDGSNAPAATEAMTGAGEASARFVTGSVYFRAEPDNAGAEIGVLDACERVVLLGTDATDYWHEVRRADGTSGWVFRNYVAGDKPAACS